MDWRYIEYIYLKSKGNYQKKKKEYINFQIIKKEKVQRKCNSLKSRIRGKEDTKCGKNKAK